MFDDLRAVVVEGNICYYGVEIFDRDVRPAQAIGSDIRIGAATITMAISPCTDRDQHAVIVSIRVSSYTYRETENKSFVI